MAEQPAPEAKAQLRKRLLADRMSLPYDVKSRLDRTLLDQLFAAIRRLRPATVAAYAPMASEPLGNGAPPDGRNVDFLPELLARPGIGERPRVEVLLPVWLVGNSLAWRRYTGADGLVVTGQGVLEPSLDSPVAQLSDAELVVVPAVAVDGAGRRLGRGAGCYDRALAETQEIRKTQSIVAVVYDQEFLDELPAEPHDVRVNAVITPSGGWRELS